MTDRGEQKLSPIPRLPVPPLRQTLDAYLESLEPFLEDLSRKSGQPKEHLAAERRSWADDYENGVGKLCQDRLIELDTKSPYNWVDDNFWTKKAYHEARLPLLIHSNWWLALAHEQALLDESLDPISMESDFTNIQVKRAAWMIHRFLIVKQQIESNKLYPANGGKEHWARRPALSIFSKYRVPNEGCDFFAPPPSPSNPYSRSVILLLNGQVCALEAIDGLGNPLQPFELYRGIYSAIISTKLNRNDISLGILTTTDRDTWASNYRHLLSLSPQNKEYMGVIESSLFAVALDTCEDLPLEQQTYDRGSLHDSHIKSIRSGRNANNRWLDKGFTLIFRPDGGCGMSGEHSPCDALVPSMVANEALKEPIELSAFIYQERCHSPKIRVLNFVTDNHLRKQCIRAARSASALIEDSDYGLLWFDDFGTSWISGAKIAPDAFVQLALQLAWYKDQKYFTAVYETALTRSFLHGRTETIRSYTIQARRFVEAMVCEQTLKEEKYKLLKDASRAHVTLSRKAMLGRGIDRHLLGLQLSMKPEESSPLLSDPLFLQSQRWLLSTSGLSAGERFIGTGFGAYKGGYGINYMPAPDTLRFCIESKHSSPHTSTHCFKALLTSSLNEMRQICPESALLEARL